MHEKDENCNFCIFLQGPKRGINGLKAQPLLAQGNALGIQSQYHCALKRAKALFIHL